jgi:sugar phosphate isomerase/epimerase
MTTEPRAAEPLIGISSWSVHRLLGKPTIYGVETAHDAIPAGDPAWRDALLALPAQMAKHGYRALHLCHFHVRDLSPGYLSALRDELTRNNVLLHTLLIDSGDITDPRSGDADLRWIMRWVPVAAELGAQHVRAIAGRQPHTPEAMARSRFGLHALADIADRHDLGVLIENWFDLLPTGEAVNQLLDACDGRVELNIDFGNFKRDKYAHLQACAPYAVSSHAKGDFTAELTLDNIDYARCLDILRAADYDGTYFLIYDDPHSDDEWAGLAVEREAVRA